MASNVFKPTNGVKPKKIPAATSFATARGESSRPLSLFHCQASHGIGFTSATLADGSFVENAKGTPAEGKASRPGTRLRNGNRELRSSARLTLDRHFALVSFHDGLDQAQAQA